MNTHVYNEAISAANHDQYLYIYTYTHNNALVRTSLCMLLYPHIHVYSEAISAANHDQYLYIHEYDVSVHISKLISYVSYIHQSKK